MAVDTNPANLEEYKGFFGNLRYQRKFLFNYYYRWADIFRTLKLEGVPKWSRADEKRYVSLSDDEIHTRFAHEIKQRDYVLAGVTVACVFGSVLFTRLSQRNVIPGVPLGIFLFGYPVGKTISNQAVSTYYGNWKTDRMEPWEKFAEWYIADAKSRRD